MLRNVLVYATLLFSGQSSEISSEAQLATSKGKPNYGRLLSSAGNYRPKGIA
jgi:hypothetical protein